jgi:hypothetical protein
MATRARWCCSGASSEVTKAPALGWPTALTFLLSLILLCSLIGWLQNVHMITTNGMYKSISAEPWITDFRHAPLDASNYLYYPLNGASAKLLDALGVLRGVAWKQFAYLNAFWASVATAAIFVFVARLSGDLRVAAAAALFHLGCGFVLLLSLINEDIMPAYALLLMSMLLAAAWFDRPTVGRVIGVGVLFTLAWLVEWRLIFPTTPALLLALAIAPLPLRRRAGLIVVLLVTIVATTGIVQRISHGHPGSTGVPELLWTGKGVDTGWAGFTWDKVWEMLWGVGSYLFTFLLDTSAGTARQAAPTLLLSVAVQAAILVACAAALWPRRNEPRVRSIAAVFLGTLAAGQVMNIYSQPQDPQMQLNVMAWLTIAWALLLAAVAGRRIFLPLAVLSIVPLVFNAASFARLRGGDSAEVATLATIEKRLPPESTVFVYWGFEEIATWHFALWSHTWDWDGTPTDEKFKWIAVDSGAIRHAHWTPEEHAQSIHHDLEAAFDKGYRVVISDVWTWSSEQLARNLGSLSAANRAPAIYAMLHDNYTATPVLNVPRVGNYYELHRRSSD